MPTTDAWPPLDVASWAPTKRSVHLYAQMLGKLRLALAPHQPNFTFTALALTPRGFSTGAMPAGAGLVGASVDVFDGTLSVQRSDGTERRIALTGERTIAAVFDELRGALRELEVDVTLSPVPQEIPDQTPFDRDDRPAIFVPDDAQRWLAVMAAAHGVYDRWRAHFFGRMGIYLWWGALDLSLMLFSGEHVEAPASRGYLLKYDLDAELMNAGFYPGDAATAPFFYAYIYPQPAACSTIPIAAPGATWSDALGEWVLPYDALRDAADPDAALRTFLDDVYNVCGGVSGWDRDRYAYTPPPLRHGPLTG